MNRSWHFQMHKIRQRLGLSPDNTSLSPSLMMPMMDSTTLVTFLFRAPPEARTIELLGSWDNFQQPYRMNHDRRRGTGFWSGCFAFNNIIFDGDRPDWSKPRSGGLKQGGTYWYFYRLNDEVEAYDDSRDYTTSCPLLPGQCLNVLEVPIEMQDPPSRCFSAGGAATEALRAPHTQTMNPDDKFASLEPPPVSKVHDRCISDLAVNGRLESGSHSSGVPARSPSVSPVPKNFRTGSVVRPPRQSSIAQTHEPLLTRESSFSSRRSWYSEGPSFAHSSVPDVYATFSPDLDSGSFELSPVLESPSPRLRRLTSVSYEEDVPVAFRYPDPFQDFDAQHTVDHDDDYNDGFDAFIDVPTSSSPQASLPPTPQWNPPAHYYLTRTSSLPTTTVCNETINIKPWTSYSDPSAQRPTGSAAEREHSSLDSLLPSSSAATLSSNGSSGPITPERLDSIDSAPRPGLDIRVSSRSGPSTHEEGIVSHEPTAISRVTARLRRLRHTSSEAAVASSSPPMYEKHEQGWSGYSLPVAIELKPATLLAPNAGMVSDSVLPSPQLMPELVRNDSFAEGVFSELAFWS